MDKIKSTSFLLAPRSFDTHIFFVLFYNNVSSGDLNSLFAINKEGDAKEGKVERGTASVQSYIIYIYAK